MTLIQTILPQAFSTAVSGILLLFLIIFIFHFIYRTTDGDQYPPGPKPLPLLGNLHILDLKKIHVSLCELSKQYGPVFTVHLGLKKVVVLAGYKIVKEAYANLSEEFGDRDITPIFHDFNQGYGIVFSNGENWKEMRRFAISSLREFGMGKKRSEEVITEETQHLTQEFEKLDGKPFDPKVLASLATSNVLSTIIFGDRFEYSDARFHQMLRRGNENIKMIGSASIQLYNIFPWLRPFIINQKRIVKNVREAARQTQELITALRDTLSLHQPRGMADSFLIQQQKDQESGKKDGLFHNQNLYYMINNLFSGGTDPTATTLRWSFLLMAKYPQVQARVQEELDRELGVRQPVMEDRKKLPFTDAVIHEIQRVADVAPLAVPRKTSCDVRLNGFLIKKGTSVLSLMTTVLKDEKEWKSPNSFDPRNFLNNEGQFLKREAFLPFSAGRRACLGESLARTELFLFFSTLLQHYRFTPPPGVSEDQLDLTPALGFTQSPSPHKLCAVRRL